MEGPRAEVSTGEERGAASNPKCGKERGGTETTYARQESCVPGSTSALTQWLGSTPRFNSSVLPSWVTGRINEKTWAMISKAHPYRNIRPEGEQRQRSN